MAVQEIKVRYSVDDSELSRSEKTWSNLDKESKETIASFRAVNAEANKAGNSIAAAGNKGSTALKNTSKEAKQAKNDLVDLGNTANKVGAAIIGYFSIQAIKGIASDIINATAEYEKFRAVLTNTLGDAENAEAALSLISDFAASTPFAVNELTGAFVKLVNQGFTPTADEMRKLGDLASSTGKSFDQLAEAVIDAQTGEFERLKEFGIRASKEGDKVKFTFKGVTQEVNNTSQSIQNYILSLGDIKGVSGSMAAVSKTLGGQISNLGDSFDQLLIAIGLNTRGGVSTAISWVTSLLGELKNAVQGQPSVFDPFIATLNGLWDTVSNLGDSFANLFDHISSLTGPIDGSTVAMEGFNRIIKATFVPLKILIAAISTLIDSFLLIQNSVANLRNFIRGEPLVDFGIDKLKKDFVQMYEILTLTDGAVQHSEQKQVDFKAKKEKEKTKITQDEIDKRFKKAIDAISREEEFEIRAAKIRIEDEEEEQREVLRIQSLYNQRRYDVIAQFNKTLQDEGKDNALKQQEIAQQQSDYELDLEKRRQEEIIKSREARTKENIAAISDINEAQLLSDQKFYDASIETERRRYAQGEIDLEQYNSNVADIEYNAQRNRLNAQIKADRDKLEVTNISADEILTVNQDITDNIKALNDLEFKYHEEKEKKKTEATKEAAENRKNIERAATDLAIELANVNFEIENNRLTSQLEALKANTEEEQRLAGDNAARKEQIANAAAIKEAQLRRRQAENERTQALFSIAVTTAQNVVKAYGTPPVPNFLLAGIALASGLAQASVVSSRPIPKFANGSKGVTGGIEGQDSVMAMLMPGEKIIPTAESRGPMGPILDGIIDRKILKPIDILKHIPLPESFGRQPMDSRLVQELKGLRSDMKKIKTSNIQFDRNGFKHYIVTSNSKQEFVNNYFKS